MTTQELQQKDLLYLSPQKTMELVLDAINEIIPYELAVILSKESEKNLRVRYSRGPLATEKINNFELNLETHPEIVDVLKTGKVKVVEETNEPHHRDTYDDIIDLPLGHSCMLAPLHINGETLGLMTLDHRQCDIFTPQRVAIANSLTKIIALALAQSNANDSLVHEKETLIFERTSLIENLSAVSEGLIGNSPAWLQVLERIKLVAPTDSHVMILGETGTGKEQVAKAIHALSKRNKKAFITLNCSALNYHLAESELFGHERGAFTGATATRRGRFELADGGTLFLDEIGDLPIDIQPKLLRAIQEGTFERLGGEKTMRADVRIICATHVDLEAKVNNGTFREDLYYRLNVFPLHLPPLRQRKEDIYLLAHHFLNTLSKKFPTKSFALTNEALNLLTTSTWPGNVRELQNTLERAAILTKNGIIQASHLVFEEKHRQHADQDDKDVPIASFDEETKKIILRALKLTNGKIYGANGAAALLKMKPTTLQSKMKKLNITV